MLATKVSAKLAQMRLGQRQSSNNSIVVACSALVVVTYLVRACLSVMSVSMASELGWTKEEEGSVLSAFFYGYICTNLTGGLACRRFGAKPVIALSVAVFSTLTFLLPSAAAISTNRLWWARVATGVAQGPIFASIFHIYGLTIPQEQRARAVAAVNACAPLGIAMCYLLGPLIESRLGWRATLRAAGLSGLPWLVTWLCKMDVDPPPAMAVLGPGTGRVATPPLNGHDTGTATTAMPASNDSGLGEGIPWKRIATEPAFLVVAFSHFAFAWGQYVMLAWLPTYFVEALGLQESQLGVAAVPYVLMMCSALSSGMLADALLKRRVKLLAVRRAMTLFGFGPSAVMLVLCGMVPSNFAHAASLKVVLLTLSMCLSTLVTGGALCNHLDISNRISGVLYGVTNSCATLTGIYGVSITAALLDYGFDWSFAFDLVAVLYLLAAACFLQFGDVVQIFP